MTMRSRLFPLAAAVAIAVFVTWTTHRADAATLLALDLPALVHKSDYIVVANAEAESSRYRTQDRLIVTDVRLRVIDSLKGAARAGEALVVTHLGGTVDRVGLSVPGEASFPAGRSAIVFLRRIDSGVLQVVGMSQGVLPIDGTGNAARVSSATSASLVQRGADGALHDAADAVPSATSLREVLARIAKLVSEGHAR